MKRLQKLFDTFLAFISLKRYIHDSMAIGVTAWWEDEENLQVSSFKMITRGTVIFHITEGLAKIYLPERIEVMKTDNVAIYQAELILLETILAHDIARWLNETSKHPFL